MNEDELATFRPSTCSDGLSLTYPQQVVRVVLVEFGERHDKRTSWTGKSLASSLRGCYEETAPVEFTLYRARLRRNNVNDSYSISIPVTSFSFPPHHIPIIRRPVWTPEACPVLLTFRDLRVMSLVLTLTLRLESLLKSVGFPYLWPLEDNLRGSPKTKLQALVFGLKKLSP